MKKLAKFFIFPFFILTSCGGNETTDASTSSEDFIRPDEYYADYSGELDCMEIDYAKRSDSTCGVEFYWSKAKVITPDHYLVLSSTDDYYKRLGGLSAPGGGSVDYISLNGIYFDDGAFEDTLRLGMMDYDYKQVFIYHSRPGRIEVEEYGNLLKSTFERIKKYASEAEIYFLTANKIDKGIIDELAISNVSALECDAADVKSLIETKMNNCTNEVTSKTRETDAYASNKRETIEWSRITFANASTLGNKNKRILHIGASVMQATYPFIVDDMANFNVDMYCSSRGSNDVATLRELDYIFRQYQYDGIHFNSGSHIKGQTSKECYESVTSLINFFKLAEPTSTMVFSNSTPRGTTSDLTKFSDAESEEIIRMSDELMRICGENDYPFDDLYNFAKDNNFVRIDAIHYRSGGTEYQKLGKELAKFFRAYIK